MIPTDHHDLWLVPKAIEQGLAERKKGGVGQTIIFEDDEFLELIECPGQPRSHSFSASHIFICKTGSQIAWPIDAVKYLSGATNLFWIRGVVGARAVANDE